MYPPLHTGVCPACVSDIRDVIVQKRFAFPALTLREKVNVGENSDINEPLTCNRCFLSLVPRQDTHINRPRLYTASGEEDRG